MKEKNKRKKGSSGFHRKVSQDFFDKNRKKQGVIETDSGLQYQIIEEGDGNESPDANAYVVAHQRCQLLDGKILIDTYKENEPSEIKVVELIEGYQEGIQLMQKGSRYKFFIPADLAWGKKGSGKKIPPNAALIFDVRLIDFW